MRGVKSSINSFLSQEAKVLSRAEHIIAGVIVTRATIIAPKLTGKLKGSGKVIRVDGHHAASFGGEDAPHGRRRHFENKKNPQTLRYLQRGGDSVKKENVKKYVDMAR